VPGDRFRLTFTAFGQWQIPATAETLWFDSLDVPVPNKNNPAHGSWFMASWWGADWF
jgi:hypothetical protein